MVQHKKQWEFLKNVFENNQLSHTYLLVGQDGIGKKEFAEKLADLIGCKFPDVMSVEPIEGKEIPVAKIREVQNFLAYKSYHGGFKTVIVNQADKMNSEAQNCFLKTLEEPKGDTMLLLVTSKPDLLLPTIFSRCQTIKFFKTKETATDSAMADKEQSLLKDILLVIDSNFAEKFKYVKAIDFEEQDAVEIVKVLQKYLRHLLMIKIGVEEAETKDTKFSKYSILQIKKAIELSETICNKLMFTNANPKLALEILLMEI